MSKFEVADGAPTGIVIHKRQADGSIKKFSADKKAATVKVSSPGKSAAKAAVARAQNKRTVSLAQARRADVDLSSHKPGEPYRYKHGWIPLEHGGGKLGRHTVHEAPGGPIVKTDGHYDSQHATMTDARAKAEYLHNRDNAGNAGKIPGSSEKGIAARAASTKAHKSNTKEDHKAAALAHQEHADALWAERGGPYTSQHDPQFIKESAARNAAEKTAQEHNLIASQIHRGTFGQKPGATFGPTREEMIQNAEKMYSSDRSKWSVANLKSAVKMGDTRSSAELLKRANKRGVEKVTAKNASQISGKLKSAKPSSVDRRKK